jgi:hypothetical protein
MNKDCRQFGCTGEKRFCDGALAAATQTNPDDAQAEGTKWQKNGCLYPEHIEEAIASVRERKTGGNDPIHN